MDFGATHKRSREVSDSIVKGVHFLMKKNKITEIDGWGTFVDAKTISVELDDGSTDEITGTTSSSPPARRPGSSPAPSSPSGS